LSGRTAQKVYVKSDARTPYARVREVLDALHTAGVDAPNLLTSQPEPPETGKIVPPEGLEVLVGPSPPSASRSIVVQALHSAERPFTLTIDDEQVSSTTLEAVLERRLQNRIEKVVLVKADGLLPFGNVVHVIDMCHSAGAVVFLATARI
jgi:biopolymer transport protein ExbD